MKTCTVCQIEKPLSDFGKYIRSGDGLRSCCKKCHNARNKKYWFGNPKTAKRSNRNSHLKRKYGITQAEFDEMVKSQNGVCAICHKDNDGKTLNVDHCHSTGKVRGLLCMNCNRGLGHFQDNPGILREAVEYAEYWAGKL